MNENLEPHVWVLNVSHGKVRAKLEMEEEKIGGSCNLGEFLNKFINMFTSLFISLYDIMKFHW